MEGKEKRWEECDVLNTPKTPTDDSEIKILSKFIEKLNLKCPRIPLTNKIEDLASIPLICKFPNNISRKLNKRLQSIFYTPSGTTCINIKENMVGTLKCENNKFITKIKYASWGRPLDKWSFGMSNQRWLPGKYTGAKKNCTKFEHKDGEKCQMDVTDIVTNECLYQQGCVLMANLKSKGNDSLLPPWSKNLVNKCNKWDKKRHLVVSVECGTEVTYSKTYKEKVIEYDERPSYLEMNPVKCNNEKGIALHIATSCSRCPYTKKGKGQIRGEGVSPQEWCGGDCKWIDGKCKNKDSNCDLFFMRMWGYIATKHACTTNLNLKTNCRAECDELIAKKQPK
jgi:hypothetical protein